MRVLVAEDEVYLAEAIQTMLQRSAMAVDVVHDGAAALSHVAVNDYDVVVLDRDLPEVHGDDVCRSLVSGTSTARILMLTAAGGLRDTVEGFELGADDYLAKPFEFDELVARLRSLGRRSGEALPPILEARGIRLDPFRREVYRDGRTVRLRRKEFAVLELLLAARGGVVSAEQLLEKAWDVNADPFTNTVRVTMSSLRRHLGEPALVETVSGVGYRLPIT
jgi:two-component system response regulator VanR